jgi:RND superfamily putative drug exporter
MDAFYAGLGRFVVRFRYLILVAWLVLGGLCVAQLPALSNVVKTQESDFLPANSASLKAQRLSLKFDLTSNTLASFTLVAATNGTKLTAQDQAEILRLEGIIRNLKHVKSVQDLGVSPDGQARQAQILAAVPQQGTGDAGALIKKIRSEFKASAPAGLTYHLTGATAENYDLEQQYGKSNNISQTLSYLVVIVLLLLAFRAILAPVVTLLTAAAALAISGPVIGELTKIGLQASTVTQGVLIVLILGAGTDYCVFLLSRMREEMGNGLSAREAVARGVETVGQSITFSGLTVIAALSSLALAQYGIYQSLGPPLAVGIAVMLLAGLTLLPALLAILGRFVFWPTRPRASKEHHEGLWARAAERAVSRPWVTLTVGLVIFIGLSLGALGVAQTGGFSQAIPTNTDSGKGQLVLQAHFPQDRTNPEVAIVQFKSSLWSNPTPAAGVQKSLASSPAFRSVAGPFSSQGFTPTVIAALYKKLGPPQALPPQEKPGTGIPPATYNAYRGLAQFFTPDGTAFQVFTVPKQNNVDSVSALNNVPALRSIVSQTAKSYGATTSAVWGLLPVAYDISQVSGNDLKRVIPIVAILIAILLAIVLRSLIAPLYLVASVVLSYFATLGLASIVFVRLGGQPNLNFVIPVVIFIFLMALGSDYNILVMTRIREEAKTLPIAVAVRRAIGSTGTSVTTAGLILGGTFAAFGVAAPPGAIGQQSREIGYGIAAGILMDTFLVRTLLVPSMVVILGRWNWWPSKLYKTEPEEPVPAMPAGEPASQASS